MARKMMAYIAEINEVAPIKGKDSIGVMTFKKYGWEVIVKKEDFEGARWALYVETNSILPEIPEFEFLRKKCFSEKYQGFVIRPMKMAGIVSNGIAFPLSLPIFDKIKLKEQDNLEDTDLTKELKIKNKSEIDANLALAKQHKKVKIKNRVLRAVWNFLDKYTKIPMAISQLKRLANNLDTEWPEALQKTDEVRIENLDPDIFDRLKKTGAENLHISIKEDGTSVSCVLKNSKFKICSRNNCVLTLPLSEAILLFGKEQKNLEIFAKLKKWIDRSQMADEVWRQLINGIRECEIPLFLESLVKTFDMRSQGVYCQGELTGPGIQKNPMGRKEGHYSLFNIGFTRSFQFALTKKTIDYLKEKLEVKTFPNIVEQIFPENIEYNLKGFKKIAKGKYKGTGKDREGIVVRFIEHKNFEGHEFDEVITDLYSCFKVSRGSFKVINDDYWLKEEG